MAARFCLVLVKPSHYDDDGYVIQWFRSAIPSNSLAALYGLARDCAARNVLGADVALEIHPIDETNTRVRPEKLAKRIQDAGAGLVMLVGVQSNQFPRSLDLARQFLALGIRVAVGGFHVSGTISMLEGRDAGLQQAKAMGVTVFAGEAEGRLEEILRDAHAGALKPFYNFMNDLPNIQGTPIPLITALRAWRTAGGVTSFDAGRGCPFQCSFCTIINVQGRKSRRRSPDDIEKIVRENVAQGLHSFFITDDNFARNSEWEAILDRLIQLKERDGIKIHFIIQVDTLCHKIPRFIEKCARAGVRRVFIGLENINPDSLVGAKKRQNKITEYRKMLLAWKEARVITYAGYILGFPNDTPESIRRDMEIIKRELPIDVLEFFFLTPLPGSEDHQTLVKNGVAVDPDLNKYDLNHVCTAHPKMSQAEWEGAYRMAWETYYTKEHVEAVLRRLIAKRASASNAILLMTWFGGSIHIENVHPLEAGLFRYKFRRDRRPGFAIEPRWKFYPKYLFESIAKLGRWFGTYAGLRLIYMKAKRDPKKYEYMDTALTPVTEHDVEELELFQPRAAAS
ncbi:MAG TPA: B12-binding domain-containing radical SAM protein [Thermoanaerobaculia bacterium]|nr:B12-binding domain-containing radical SAM protein [Thermoanaerobaculia bacterium]